MELDKLNKKHYIKKGKMYILMLYNVEANRISLEQEQAKKYMQILDTADIQKIWINAYIF